jgi:hypothetical protein
MYEWEHGVCLPRYLDETLALPSVGIIEYMHLCHEHICVYVNMLPTNGLDAISV